MRSSKLKQFGLVMTGMVAGIMISLNFSANADRSAPLPLPVDELRAYADVFNAIKQGYVEPVEDKKLITDSIGGMLSGQDPHSAYLDADEPTQIAVFGVLVARLSDDVRRARKTPGWYRHELAGEDDARYPAAASAPHLLHDTPAPLQVPGDMDNLTPPAGTEPRAASSTG